MKAQNVKNTLIVPVGAKGGFVAQAAAGDAARARSCRREVIACYRTFIRGLLDLTDNIVAGKSCRPRSVRRRDGDDPYLVVAADKGTATFSDIANAISAEYGFWLGDAFASGGSAGYDHKKMGITARGAWECVKRHFREIGVDIQRKPSRSPASATCPATCSATACCCSRQIRLLAAFDHQHIFLDPDPDAGAELRASASGCSSCRARAGTTTTARRSRAAAECSRAPRRRSPCRRKRSALLGIWPQRAAPDEIMRAILCMRVDLLWNGGIGTYVKASERVQRARSATAPTMRYASMAGRCGRTWSAKAATSASRSAAGSSTRLAGGRLNTDFIDNSAGVNTSDVEVNLKILLNPPVPSMRAHARRAQPAAGAR